MSRIKSAVYQDVQGNVYKISNIYYLSTEIITCNITSLSRPNVPLENKKEIKEKLVKDFRVNGFKCLSNVVAWSAKE